MQTFMHRINGMQSCGLRVWRIVEVTCITFVISLLASCSQCCPCCVAAKDVTTVL